jgi:hypothetical protein
MTNLRNAICFSLLLIAAVPLALAQGTYTQIDYPIFPARLPQP